MNLEEKIQRIKELMISEEMVQSDAWKSIKKTIDILKKKKKVLLLSCSNRYNWDKNDIDVPKSKMLAMYIKEQLGDKSVLIDVTDLKILPCEGNVSRKDGNTCGVLKSKLDDKEKNPSGHHRCWANFNDKSDELWKISKELFESDAVIFFSSIRWGQANMYYQNLIERLNWLENRHTTLGESNIIENIETGFICVGQNWNGENVTETQKKVHEFYGFNPNSDLYWNWQYTKDETDETKESYKKAYDKFIKDTKIPNQNENKTN
jgi:multimeric flavodoxin WrbA